MAIKKKTRNAKKKQKKRTRKSRTRRKLKSVSSALDFLSSTHVSVRSHLKAATDLPTFLSTAGELTLNARKRLVEQAILLINDNFVHLTLKKSMHGVDPSQKLTLIRHRLEQLTPATMGSEFAFHREMISTFTSLRDLHTNYMLPAPFSDKVAFLPFDVEEYYEGETQHFIATHFVPGFSHAHFKKGVKIISWNGVPIERAVEVSGDLHAGSNSEARRARGIDGLTLRALAGSLPPDEVWVIISYVDLGGVERELKQEWIVTPTLPDASIANANSLTEGAAAMGIDIEADIRQRARKMLYVPEVIAKEKKKNKSIGDGVVGPNQSVESTMPGVFRSSSVTTPDGEFGYIRIFTFSVDNPKEFILEFARLARLLPQRGLMIDVRGNGGGHIYASEGLLQLLTPVEITPEPTQFINSALNARICARHSTNPTGQIDLGPWLESMIESVETGAPYSRGVPITPVEFANEIGQTYHGPVVLITDARCYSATDIFAAGFKDHLVGQILGVDGNTGAGGANVWTHGLLRELLRLPLPADSQSPYEQLPSGANLRVAIRRTLRVGDQAGTPVEDLGVKPDVQHKMTKEDLLNGNVDLINRAASLLTDMPVYKLSVDIQTIGSTLNIQVTTDGVNRLDLYTNGRPIHTLDVANGTHTIAIDALPEGDLLEFAGYDEDDYVAALKVRL